MTKFVEGLRASLETATLNMDEFLMSVTAMVTLNADTVLAKYQETKLPLDDAITNPWEAAKEAVGNYSGDALGLMDQWVQNGFLTTFPETVSNSLKSPWVAGQAAAAEFQSSVDAVMAGVVKSIETNVQSASGQLETLLQDIRDTEKRAAEADVTVDPDPDPDPDPSDTKPKRWTTWQQAADAGYSNIAGASRTEKVRAQNEYGTYQNYLDAMYYKYMGKLPDGVTKVPQPIKQTTTTNTQVQQKPNFKDAGFWTGISIGSKKYDKTKEIVGSDNKIYYPYTNSVGNTGYIRKNEGYKVLDNGKIDIQSFEPMYKKYAKGTTGTTRDQWAITNEPQFGDELAMYATPEGTLSFMRAGSTVVPADITANLVEWGKLNPDMLNVGGTPNMNMISNAVNKPELNITFDSLIKAENITEETLPAVKKLVTQELNRFTKELNYALKGKGAR